jgi:hypothetical protein
MLNGAGDRRPPEESPERRRAARIGRRRVHIRDRVRDKPDRHHRAKGVKNEAIELATNREG